MFVGYDPKILGEAFGGQTGYLFMTPFNLLT